MALLNSVGRAAAKPFRVMAALYKKTVFSLSTYDVSQPIKTFNRAFNWMQAQPESSTIVVACLRWIQRTFTEAPPVLVEWLPSTKEWETHPMGDLLDLLETPNPFYNGATLWKATIADRIFNGTAYWIKVRDDGGIVCQLWWAPECTITPVSNDPHVFIEYYEYRPRMGVSMIKLDVNDVIRFPDGIDPNDPKKGNSAVKTLLKEIYTDETAASTTVALLKNLGIPGVIISPDQGTIGEDAAKSIGEKFQEKFTGDNRGVPLVLQGKSTVTTFGFNPQQMDLRVARGIPEERICAVIGINVAVTGLGQGLQTTKVGATLREYREEAFESTIIPMYRELAGELRQQLVPEFYPSDQVKYWKLGFDLTQIRVLQDDMNKKAEALTKQLIGGGIKRSEYRRSLGYQVGPADEVYYMPTTNQMIDGEATPDDLAATSTSTTAGDAPPTGEPEGDTEPGTQAKRQVVLNFNDTISVDAPQVTVEATPPTEVHAHINVQVPEQAEQELVIARDDFGRPKSIRRIQVKPSKNGVH